MSPRMCCSERSKKSMAIAANLPARPLLRALEVVQHPSNERSDPFVSKCFMGEPARPPIIPERPSYLSSTGELHGKASDSFGPRGAATDIAVPSAGEPNRCWPLPDVSSLRALSAECGYDAALLATRLRISTRHLRRLFMKHLGCSAASWLREERLQSAQRALLSASCVKEVAHGHAFRNASQFCRDFKARFGVTPSECRRGRARR